MENFCLTRIEYEKAKDKLMSECAEYMMKMVKEHGEPNPVDGDLCISLDPDSEFECVCTDHDDVVYCVFINKKGRLCFSTEYSDNINYDDLSVDELYNIALVVYGKYS